VCNLSGSRPTSIGSTSVSETKEKGHLPRSFLGKMRAGEASTGERNFKGSDRRAGDRLRVSFEVAAHGAPCGLGPEV